MWKKVEIQEKGREIKKNVSMLYRGMHDERMPWYVKLLVVLTVAYILSPIDLIPDFIPVIGFLDEIILVPIVLALIYKLIPEQLINEYQQQEKIEIKNKYLSAVGLFMILVMWVCIIGLSWILIQ